MLRRQDLDPLFTEKFFNIQTEVESFQINLDFPTPASFETLTEFLSKPEGALFKSAAFNLIQDLIDWVQTNQLNPQILSDLRDVYFQIDIDSEETFHSLFNFCQQGIPSLVGILNLLKAKIDEEDKKLLMPFHMATIQNLLSELRTDKTPNLHIHFIDAYSTLRRGFPVPESPQTLAHFLAHEDGELLRKCFAELADEFIKQANTIGISKQKLDNLIRFKKYFIEYSAIDESLNVTVFPFFQHGISQLREIVLLLKNEVIPLEARNKALSNFSQGAMVCTPGVYTHVSDMKSALESYLNISLALANFRKKIAESFFLQEFQPYVAEAEDRNNKKIRDHLVGNEIHYANKILNSLHQILSFPAIDDAYIEHCIKAFSEEVNTKVSNQIKKNFNAFKIIHTIIAELDLDSVANFSQKACDFEKKLYFYGLEDPRFPFSFIKWFPENDDCTHSVAFKTPYVLFLNLFHRLAQGGFFRIDAYQEHTFTEEKTIVYYIPENTLWYAYVCYNGEFQPFLSYCIDICLSRNQEEKIEELIKFIKYKLVSNYAEISEVVFSYLRSSEFKSLSDEVKQYQINKLLDFIRRIHPVYLEYLASILVSTDDPENLGHLFKYGISPDSVWDQRSLLMMACDANDFDLAFIILKLSKLPNYKNKNHETALLYAINRNANIEIIKQLLKAGLKPNKKTKDGLQFPLLKAVKFNNLPVTKLLIESDANVNQQDVNGQTALMLAVQYGLTDLVKFLLINGASKDLKDNANENAFDKAKKSQHANRAAIKEILLARNFYEAVLDNDIEKVKNLFKADLDGDLPQIVLYGSNPFCAHGRTLLMLAAQNGCLALVRFLLTQGFKASVRDENNETAADISKKYPHFASSAITKILLGHELYEAVVEDDKEKVKSLLKSGANPNVLTLYDSTYSTSLCCAVDSQDVEMVELLLKEGKADPNLKDPLMWAFEMDEPEADIHARILNLLFKAGATPTSDHFIHVCSDWNWEFAAQLIEYGFNINGSRSVVIRGTSACAFEQVAQNLEALFKQKGIDPSQTAIDMSLLHDAVFKRNFTIAEYLLEIGADILQKSSGISVVELAKALFSAEDEEFMVMLEKAEQEALANMEITRQKRKEINEDDRSEEDEESIRHIRPRLGDSKFVMFKKPDDDNNNNNNNNNDINENNNNKAL